jgi:hypothetical protein
MIESEESNVPLLERIKSFNATDLFRRTEVSDDSTESRDLYAKVSSGLIHDSLDCFRRR